MQRCPRARSPEEISYHDKERWKENHDDSYLFEMLILEGMQAGLSRITILKKRENYRKALDNFDYQKIQKYDESKKQELMKNAGIIRNKLKIEAIIKNAKAFIEIQKEFWSFDSYIWWRTKGKQTRNHFKDIQNYPTTSELSDTISKDLKKRGMNFVGSTIIYSYLQAIGIINDHMIQCNFK